jgi:hypothetical protein
VPKFIPGVRLNEMFYREAVAPILASCFPNVRYTAALIGAGSDVLGYDSERSTDHEWGPRLLIFLSDEDYALAKAISEELSARLPQSFLGYSTNFEDSADPDDRVRWMAPGDTGRVHHHVYFHTLRNFIQTYLGIEPAQTLTHVDWLLIHQNRLLEVTAGAVYHDGLGELLPLREKLRWYPRDVWLFMLVSQWIRLSQEEAFPSRCGEDGDEIGSRINTARMVREVMRLSLLLETRYSPYSKWLGAAFQRLKCARELGPTLQAALAGESWKDRERHLCIAYETVARMQNALGIFGGLDTGTTLFHERPYLVLGARRFAKAVSNEIRDDQLRKIYETVGPIGSIDQFADSTDLLMRADLRGRLRHLFDRVN